MTDTPDGYIEVTVTARYPVYLSSYSGEGEPKLSLDEALALDKANYDNDTVGIDDVLSWCDVTDTTWKVVPNG